jgi:drug/metabolite transporter (DMT)-like permease
MDFHLRGNDNSTQPGIFGSEFGMTHHKHRFDIIASLCCVGFVSCWTIGSLQIEYLTGELDVWTQNFGRYGVACLFWLPFLLHHLRRGTVPKRLWLAAIPVFAGNMIMQSCWGGSFYYADPGFITLLQKTSIIWVASFSLIFFIDERALLKSVFFWIGLCCSLTGVIGVILCQQDFSFQTSLRGAILPVVSSIAWAVYSLTAKVKFKGIDSRISFAAMTIYMTVGLGMLSLLFGNPSQLVEMDVKGWANLVTSGVSAIALAHVFYYVALHRIGATIPAFCTILASRLVFGETLTSGQLAFGSILIIGAAAAILAQRDLQKK